MNRNLSGAALAALLCAPWPALAADYAADAAASAARGDLRAAQLQYRNAVRDQPAAPRPHFGLASVDLMLGDPVAAEKEARLARSNGYDAAASTTLIAQALMAQGRYADLLADMPSDPASPPALAASILAARATAQMALGRGTDAEASLAQAQAQAPGTLPPLLAQRQLALMQGDVAKADALLQAAAKINPADSDVLLAQAQTHARLGDKAAALTSFEAAYAAAPGSFGAAIGRASILMALNQDARARKEVDAILVTTPNAVQALYLRAQLEARAKDWRAADADLTRISSARSKLDGAYLLEALIKANTGEKEQALDAATKYNSRAPENPEGAKLFASLSLDAGRPAMAVAALEKLPASAQADPSVLDLLGRAYAQNEAWKQAAAAFQQAAALVPNDAPILVRLGESRLHTGENAQALNAFDAAQKLAPDQPGLGLMIATAALAAGSLDRADAAIKQVAAAGETEQLDRLRGTLAIARMDTAAAKIAFTAAMAKAPQSAGAAIGLAHVAVLQGDLALSQRLLTEVLQRDPVNLAAIEALAAQSRASGRGAEMVPVLERAHQAAPAMANITLALAEAYVATNMPQKALGLVRGTNGASLPQYARVIARAEAALNDPDAAEQFRRLVAADPHDIASWHDLLVVLAGQPDLAPAQMTAADALAAQPGTPLLLRDAVSIALKAGGLPAGLAMAAKLQADPAQRPAANLLTGEVYAGAQQMPQAISAYTAAMAAEPSLMLALRLAEAQVIAQQPDAAAHTLQTWLAAHPDDPDAALELGMLDIAAGRLKDAEAHLAVTLAKRPNDAVALNDMAWTLQQRGAPAARGTAERAFQIAPNPQSADTLGWILASAPADPAALAKAVPLLRMASTQMPNDPDLAFHYAVALQRSGETTEAVRVLTPVVKGAAAFPGRPEAERALGEWSKGR